MKSVISKVFVGIGLLIVTGCTKQNIAPNQPADAPPVDVYVGGVSSNVATWWKNGVIHKISDSTSSSRGTSIVVLGNDVYLAGNSIKTDSASMRLQSATCWKNGAFLMAVPFDSSSNTSVVVVRDSSVYFLAKFMIPYHVYSIGVFASNGGGKSLRDETPDAVVAGLTLNGSDIYAVGTSAATAAYCWKNETITFLTAGVSPSFANAIAISGNDVYIAGTAGPASSSTPLYWKNGTAYPLAPPADSTQVSGIAVSGSDVYVSGTVLASASGKTTVAVYWKNGVETKLTYGSASTVAHAIAINGPDIYVVGTANDGTGAVPIIWKNGVATKLANNGEATCLVLVPNNS